MRGVVERGFELDGVRAGRQSGSFFEHGPQVDATFIAADDGGFGAMQLNLVKAELRGANQELSIRIETHFVAAAMRISQYDLSDRRWAVFLREHRDVAIEVQRDPSLLIGLCRQSRDNLQQERHVLGGQTQPSLRGFGGGDDVLDARIAALLFERQPEDPRPDTEDAMIGREADFDWQVVRQFKAIEQLRRHNIRQFITVLPTGILSRSIVP